MIAPTFKVDFASFDRQMADYAKAAGLEMREAVKEQSRLLGRELMDRTPPLSGKTILRALSGRQNAQLRDIEVSNLNARQVGIRRVEKDIRRVIFGVKKDAVAGDTTQHVSKAIKRKLKGTGRKLGGLPIQQCQGKLAVRIFATKGGDVYGTDYATVKPAASIEDMAKFHTAARTKRGRVTTAGTRTVNVGRWRWLSMLVTKEARAKAYIRKKQRAVGQAKAGWGAGYVAAGGRLGAGGWIGRHVISAGSERHQWDNARPWITFINRSRWATSGDPDRVIAQSLLGRAKALAGDIRRRLEGRWQQDNKMRSKRIAMVTEPPKA